MWKDTEANYMSRWRFMCMVGGTVLPSVKVLLEFRIRHGLYMGEEGGMPIEKLVRPCP